MVDPILDLFDIRSSHDLDIMSPDQNLAGLTSRAVVAVDGFLAAEMPDAVLVQGDTTSVMAAAMAAFYRRLPVGHVEAGLRTFDYSAPFPEEMNRVVVGRLATWHFAPTTTARTNLLREGTRSEAIHVTGNTVVDALLKVRETLRRGQPPIAGLPASAWPLDRGRRLILITSHRRENFGDPLEQICRAIASLAARYRSVEFVFPVHPNPAVRKTVLPTLSGHTNVHLIEPVGYLEMVALLDAATVVLTDSGGLQEEGPTFGKPVLVMRAVSERPEAVAAGVAKLVGTNTATIVEAVSELLDSPQAYDAMARASNPFGDGTAARRIADVLLREVP